MTISARRCRQLLRRRPPPHLRQQLRWIDRLTQGDKVVVVDNRYPCTHGLPPEIIDATDPTLMRVAAPVIDDVSWSGNPTMLDTMTTSHPEYGNWQRYIVQF